MLLEQVNSPLSSLIVDKRLGGVSCLFNQERNFRKLGQMLHEGEAFTFFFLFSGVHH